MTTNPGGGEDLHIRNHLLVNSADSVPDKESFPRRKLMKKSPLIDFNQFVYDDVSSKQRYRKRQYERDLRDRAETVVFLKKFEDSSESSDKMEIQQNLPVSHLMKTLPPQNQLSKQTNSNHQLQQLQPNTNSYFKQSQSKNDKLNFSDFQESSSEEEISRPSSEKIKIQLQKLKQDSYQAKTKGIEMEKIILALQNENQQIQKDFNQVWSKGQRHYTNGFNPPRQSPNPKKLIEEFRYMESQERPTFKVVQEKLSFTQDQKELCSFIGRASLNHHKYQKKDVQKTKQTQKKTAQLYVEDLKNLKAEVIAQVKDLTFDSCKEEEQCPYDSCIGDYFSSSDSCEEDSFSSIEVKKEDKSTLTEVIMNEVETFSNDGDEYFYQIIEDQKQIIRQLKFDAIGFFVGLVKSKELCSKYENQVKILKNIVEKQKKKNKVFYPTKENDVMKDMKIQMAHLSSSLSERNSVIRVLRKQIEELRSG